MDKKRTTRASSDVRRAAKKSPARRRSPSPVPEEVVAPAKVAPKKQRGRPKSNSRNAAEVKPSPKKSPRTADKSPATKSSPRKGPSIKLDRLDMTKVTESSSTASSTKTLTLTSSAAALKFRSSQESRSKRASMTPATEMSHRSLTRSMSRSVFDRDFSDQDDDLEGSMDRSEKRQTSIQRQDQVIQHGWISAALLLLVPVLLAGCIVTGKTILAVQQWFSLEAVSVFVLFVAAVSLAAVLPSGRIVEIPRGDDDDTIQYIFNGFATLLLAILAMTFSNSRIHGFDFVYDHYKSFFVASILTAWGVAVAAYWRAKYQANSAPNAFANSGKPLCDFFMGREIGPRWFNTIDAKLTFYRVSIITAAVVNIVLLSRALILPQVEANIDWKDVASVSQFVSGIRGDAASIAAASMVIVYCMDAFLFEHHLTSSFDVQYEGFGAYLLTRYAIFPFLASAVPMHLVQNASQAVKCNCWLIGGAAVIFLVGLVVKRCADRIKYKFRMNPHDPKFEHLDIVPTFQGQGLIAGHLWRVVRHPNYLGEMLVFASFLPLLTSVAAFSWTPLVAILYLLATLVLRASRVDKRSTMKYHSTWMQYTKRVPKLLVPHVY